MISPCRSLERLAITVSNERFLRVHAMDRPMSRTVTTGKCRTRTSRPMAERSHGRDARVKGIAFLRLMLALVAVLLMIAADVRPAAGPRRLVFDGVLCEHRLALKDIESSMPSDWTGYTHLVMEMRTSTPQRFGHRTQQCRQGHPQTAA